MTTLRIPPAAFGVGYGLWIRGRRTLAATWFLVLALALAIRFVPGFSEPLFLAAGIKLALPAFVLALPVVLVPVVALLDVFTYGPIDVNARSSSFPMHARLLPMSTRALVGWPMLFGVVTLLSVWLAFLALVLRPTGLTTSVVWPTTIVVACTAWVQAIAWIPCPLRFVRTPLLLFFVGVPLALAGLDLRSEDFFWPLEAGMVLWAGAAYAIATIGLGRESRGDPRASAGVRASRSGRGETSGRAFPTATAARRWYDLRRTTSFFAIAFGCTALPIVAASIFTVCAPNATWLMRGPRGFPSATIAAIVYVIGGPLLASAALGALVGRFDIWTRPGISSFFATRPVTTSRLVGDKLVSATFGALLMFAASAVVAISGAWAFFAKFPARIHLLEDHVVDIVLLAVVLAFALWRNLVVDLWTTLSGRRWTSRSVAVYSVLAFALVPLTATSLQTNRDFRELVVAVVPVLARGILVAKLGAAAFAATMLVRRRLVSVQTLVVCLAAWCAASAAALAIASRWVTLSSTAACLVLAFVPLARIACAPLALAKNRHR